MFTFKPSRTEKLVALTIVIIGILCAIEFFIG